MATRAKTIVSLLLLAAGVLLTGCGSDPESDSDLRLRITSSEDDDADMQVAEGASISMGEGFSAVEITIESVDGETVVISTDHPMAPRNPGGGINLNDLESEFTVTFDEPAEFATPTTDVGVGYTVTLERAG
ncbi:hypothetical protein [Blastococcus sp. Marseille-P5729]|uniref:hypothetical protein n=1 Tax=Blastococcus sp. Marseille-P5729 TaxID=2086582 RepID=UPI000D0F4B42|nr:hypothetical protein [Blastococcus sp. Marseille-P5729]